MHTEISQAVVELKCKKTFRPYPPLNYIAFKRGKIYRVLEKYPDNLGRIDKGVWLMIAEAGETIGISYDERQEYFNTKQY